MRPNKVKAGVELLFFQVFSWPAVMSEPDAPQEQTEPLDPVSEVERLKHDLALAARTLAKACYGCYSHVLSEIGKHLLEDNNALKAENATLQLKVRKSETQCSRHFY